jgi:hypothetical protein
MELKLTIKDKFDLMLISIALNTLRQYSMKSYQTILKPTTDWKTETEDELDRLSNLNIQVIEQLKQ